MYKRLLFLFAVPVLFSPAAQAQIIQARFNKNACANAEHARVHVEELDRILPMDTIFRDLPVTIHLTADQLKDTAVQRHLEEIAGAYEGLAKALGYDRVVTQLDVGKSRFLWTYIYDVIRSPTGQKEKLDSKP